MKIKKSILISLLLFSNANANILGSLFGYTHHIIIENGTNKPLYAAVYHTTKKSAKRGMRPVPLPVGEVTSLRAPWPRLFKKRMLLLASKKESFTETMSKEQLLSMKIPPIYIPSLKKTSIIVTANQKINLIRHKDKAAFHQYVRAKIARKIPNHGRTVSVQKLVDKQSLEEQAYVTKRRQHGRKSLQKTLKRHIHPTIMPSVSACISGGGMRAMIGSFGLLQGLKKIGLLDTVLYQATLSGSCWGPACWLAENKSLDDFIAGQTNRYVNVTGFKKLMTRTAAEFRSLKYTRKLFGHGTSFGHWFGLMLAKIMLKPINTHYQTLTLSQLAHNLDYRRHPFPIMTTVSRTDSVRDVSYHWVEQSPYDIRLVTGDYSIPAWASMRRFKKGVSIDSTPEMRLSSYLGIWGSAFNLSLTEFILRLPDKVVRWFPKGFVDRLLRTKASNKKLLATHIPNFSYQLPNKGKLSEKKDLIIADAGFASNIPITTFLHAGREQDLLIVLNASITEGSGLENIFKFRRLLQSKFPKMTFDVDTLMGQPVSYWPSKDLGTPNMIVVSMHSMASFNPHYNPRDDGGASLSKFNYSPDDVTNLVGLMSHIVVEHKNIFMQAISDTIKKRETLLSLFQRTTSRVKSWFIR